MRNYDIYYKKMAKNIVEKTDFLIDEIEKSRPSRVIDFGCANGKTTEFLASIFPDVEFIGIDKDFVIKSVKKENSFANIFYTSDLDSVVWEGSLLFFSSVLHELFSENDEFFFINQMLKVDTIVIRDLFHSDQESSFYSLPASQKEREFLSALGKDHFTFKLYSQYLIKSLYKDNWEEEIKEDYFCVPFEKIINRLKEYDFVVTLDKPYFNHFIVNKIRENTGENYKDTGNYTHRKLVIKKLSHS